MGQSAPALKDHDGGVLKFNIPMRDGNVTTHRNAIFNDLNQWSLGR